MKVILSHPLGNQNVRNALKGLVNENLLDTFITGIACFPNSYLETLSKIKYFSEIRRRSFPSNLRNQTKTKPFMEVGRLLAQRLKFNSLTEHEKGLFCVDNVFKDLDLYVSRQLKKQKDEIAAVYTYEDCAFNSFSVAKQLNVQCIYDLTIGYWRTARDIMHEESEKNPQWSKTITGLKDSQKKLDNKDQELKLADHILVASSFTARTLKDYPGELKNISVIPYGFPESFSIRSYDKNLESKKLKLLFVGGLSQRKGISYLFEAAEKLQKFVELTIIGRKPIEDCHILNKSLTKHTWIPSLPHDKILEQMRCHDILVFPSLFEGFGLVITEAMSQGTPVITTERTAGKDLIKHGENGWLINSGSTDDLIKVLEDILTKPVIIEDIGKKALETAKNRPWSVYSAEIAEKVRSIVEN